MTEEIKYYTGNCITDLHTDTSISYCNEEKCKQYIKSDGLKFCMSSVCPEKDCIYALVYKLHQTIDRLEQERDELKQEYKQAHEDFICSDTALRIANTELDELKQENKELRQQYNCYACDTCQGKEDYRNMKRHCENAIKTVHTYRSVLEEIKEVLKFYADTWVDEKIYPNLHYDNTKAKEGLSKINEALK